MSRLKMPLRFASGTDLSIRSLFRLLDTNIWATGVGSDPIAGLKRDTNDVFYLVHSPSRDHQAMNPREQSGDMQKFVIGERTCMQLLYLFDGVQTRTLG